MLNEAKARLREVEEGLAALQSKYEECMAKKEELKQKCELCEARLQRAEKVHQKGWVKRNLELSNKFHDLKLLIFARKDKDIFISFL